MSKVLFRLYAWIVFISLSVSVFLCLYVPPQTMHVMREMASKSTLTTHLDHIHLLTTAVFWSFILVSCISVFHYLTSHFLKENKLRQSYYFLYEEPPGIHLRHVILFVDNQRAPPLS